MTQRIQMAADAYFHNSLRPIPWASLASMLRDPSGWTAEGIEEMATLVRAHRALEVCRLGAWLEALDCARAPSRVSERRQLRDAERALRAALSQAAHADGMHVARTDSGWCYEFWLNGAVYDAEGGFASEAEATEAAEARGLELDAEFMRRERERELDEPNWMDAAP